MADNASIIAAAAASSLLRYHWPDRGLAPAGYTNGMAVAFAEVYRKLKANDPLMAIITKPRTHNAEVDVLDHYSPQLAAAGASDATPTDRLIGLFAVMLGLGMRESSGKHCEGPDTPTDRGPPGHPIETTAENAEAGLFQVSYDSIGGHADRQAIVDAYVGRTDLQAVFTEGTSCLRPGQWPREVGAGAPAAFQALNKHCPLFAAIYTAFLLRQRRKHWGPINRHEAEANAAAVQLFEIVQGLVDAE